jgi:PIN domain nuclease of toxin-antitoxin system
VILLDTHAAIWLVGSPDRLSAGARAAILHARSTGEELGYSPVSLYEIAYTAHRNRLRLNASIRDFIAALEDRFKSVPLSASIAICAAELPDHFHGDPIDRMIAATAIVEDCVLLTADGRIRQAGVCQTLW